MTGHLTLQIVSFLSRIIAMFSGIFQSLIIVNLLTTKEYGIIGLVTSIAGIAGITQHLGLAASSTKEISQAKSSNDIFHIVVASLGIRFFISFPIAFVLFFFAPQIANFYNSQELILPLRIFGGVTLIQSFQSIFNSVISGSQKFRLLFTYQVLISFISVVIFVPFVYLFKLEGYFYSLVIFNLIQTFALGYFSFRLIGINVSFPSKKTLLELSGKLLKISLAIYLVKIIFTAWQELPVAVLGKLNSIETLALFTFAFNLASKLMAVSDSVTDVNLPVFSKKSSENMQNFIKDFTSNFNLIFYFISFLGFSVAIWSREVLIYSDLFIYYLGVIVGIPLDKNIYNRYQESLVFFLPLVTSIIFYSFINIFKSSVMIPLERVKNMVIGYVLLISLTFLNFYLLRNYYEEVYSMSISLAIAAFLSFLFFIFDLKKVLGINLFDVKKVIFIVCSLILCIFVINSFDFIFFYKFLIYIGYIVTILLVFKLNILALFKRKK